MKSFSAALASSAAPTLLPATTGQKTVQKQASMHLTRTISGKTLKNSETTRDCLSLLPLTLTPEDDGGIEKTASPSRTLSPGGAPAGTTPKAGDIAYDAPLGNLALFHKDFRYSSGLIILGRLDEGVNVVRQLGNVQVISNISK